MIALYTVRLPDVWHCFRHLDDAIEKAENIAAAVVHQGKRGNRISWQRPRRHKSGRYTSMKSVRAIGKI